MYRKLLKLSLACFAGTVLVISTPRTAAAACEEAIAGFVYDKDTSSTSGNSDGATISNLSINDIPLPGFQNLAIANVDTNLLIRSGAGENYKIIGKLPRNAGCDITESLDNGWSKISAKTSSETLTGYVKSEYLITGSKATNLAREVGNYVATANTNGLYVRGEASVDAPIIDQIAKGEELLVLDSTIITDNSDHKIWVKVSLDSDDTEEGSTAYVAKEYVDISFQLVHALSIQEIQYGAGVSQTRINLVNNAKEHLGERYVWGGTRLGVGVDCSGFTQALYRLIGVSIPRTSRSQASGGTSVSASNLKPGDLVFYGSSSYINHVAMYIGNGRVIHASNRRDGIKISNMYYRSPVKYARYLSN